MCCEKCFQSWCKGSCVSGQAEHTGQAGRQAGRQTRSEQGTSLMPVTSGACELVWALSFTVSSVTELAKNVWPSLAYDSYHALIHSREPIKVA